jgi:L,D-peptidoglycan transpeptidase YkuD (ErfK/YbiS/YcfS/YnhG family)
VTPRFDDLVITRWGARFQGQSYPCAIGRGGIGQKRGEGDGITPEGIFHIQQVLVRPDRMDFEAGDVTTGVIGLGDIWSDDPADPAYNTGLTAFAHPYSHEALRRADALYDTVAVLDYNRAPVVPGAGSAIFLHIWRKPRHPTEGCVAFDRFDLVDILSRWTDRSRVIVRG